MNPEKPSREEIEARITALLLGELPAEEATLLRRTISQDAGLQKLHDELQSTIVLVHEAKKNTATAPAEANAPLKLSDERRQKLLAHFKTPRPKESFWIRRLEIPSLNTLVVAALVIVAVVGLAALSIPNYVKARATSPSNAVVNNLRQIDAAKNQWALENKKSAADVPTPDDLTPYLVHGKIPPPVMGETYVLGSVSEPVSAELDAHLAQKQLGATALRLPAGGSVNGQHAFLNTDGELSFGDKAPVPAKVTPLPSEVVTVTSEPVVAPPPAAIVLPESASSPEVAQTDTLKSEAKLESVEAYFQNNSQVGAQMPTEAPAASTIAPNSLADSIDRSGESQQSGGYVNAGMILTNAVVTTPADAFALPNSSVSQPVTSGGSTIAGEVNSYAANTGQNFAGGGGGFGGFGGRGELAYSSQNSALQSRAQNNAAPVAGSFDLKAGKEFGTTDNGILADNSSTSGTTGLGMPVVPAQNSAQLAWAGSEMPADRIPPGTTFARRLSQSTANPQGAFSSNTGDKLAGNGNKVPLIGDVPAMGNLFQGSANASKTAPAAAPILPSYNSRLTGESGSEALALNGNNSFSGGTTVSGGTISSAPSDGMHNEQNGVVFKLQNGNPQQAMDELKKMSNAGGGGGGGSFAFETTNTIIAQKDEDNSAALAVNEAVLRQSDEIVERDRALKMDKELPKAALPAPIPQPEVLTSENNFSTFSLNVSDVSFQLAAASLEKGQMPDAASIRSEEFINAFDYRDPEAAPGRPMAFTAERARYPFAQNRDLLRFSIKTAAAGRSAGRALNLVLLLDISGSMERADRVAIIHEALRVLAGQLQPQDTVSVVTFARTARLWADGIPGDKAGETLDKVGGITPEGGTNLEEAMRLAYETARRHYLANGMNRVVLLTDGAANLGNVDPDVLRLKVEAQRKQGIALDCFGIGFDGYDDEVMEQLSRNGDGRYAFINSPAEAGTEFATKLAGALQVAASDVKVQVEFNPDRVISYRQIGYAKHQLTKEQFRDNSVLAAEIAAQEAGNALYTIETKPDGTGPIATVRVRYKVPGTTDYQEHSWEVAYEGKAPALEQASPAMRLAATASAFSEWLADSPFAQEVTPDELLEYLSGVPEVYGADGRPKKLEWMIRQAKSLSGK